MAAGCLRGQRLSLRPPQEKEIKLIIVRGESLSEGSFYPRAGGVGHLLLFVTAAHASLSVIFSVFAMSPRGVHDEQGNNVVEYRLCQLKFPPHMSLRG